MLVSLYFAYKIYLQNYKFCDVPSGIINAAQRGKVKAKNQVPISLIYKTYELSRELKIDILVENEIILELKSSEIMHPVYEAQIISYLKLTNKKLGFLINFNVPVLKDGFKRYVNNF